MGELRVGHAGHVGSRRGVGGAVGSRVVRGQVA